MTSDPMKQEFLWHRAEDFWKCPKGHSPSYYAWTQRSPNTIICMAFVGTGKDVRNCLEHSEPIPIEVWGKVKEEFRK